MVIKTSQRVISKAAEFSHICMKKKLNENGNIILRTSENALFSDNPNSCGHSTEAIDPEDHRIVLAGKDWPSISYVHVSLEAVDDLVGRLRDRGEMPEESRLEWSEDVGKSFVNKCLVCGNDDYGDDEIVLAEVPSGSATALIPIVHEDCVDQLADDIESVWDHSDELLSEVV